MAITNLIGPVWSARLLQGLRKSLIYGQPGIANRDYEPEIKAFGDRVYVHQLGDVSIASYVKNSTSISYENLTDSRQELVIDQQKYFAFRSEDIEQIQANPEFIDTATEQASYQLAQVADQYLASFYSAAGNFVATSQATTSNIYSKLVASKVKLDELNVPTEGRYAIVAPWIAGLLLENATFLAASKESALNGAIGQVAGIDILVSNNVPTTGSAPVVTHVTVGHASALAFAEQILNVEALRLESSFADGIRGLYTYGAKVLQPNALLDLRLNP